MKEILSSLLRIYAGLTAIGAALVAVAAAALFASGALTGERLSDALRVVREGPPRPVAPRPPGEEAALREEVRRAAEDALARRQEDLRRLETRVAARALLVEADRARLEEDRRRHAETAAQLRAERESAGTSGAEEASSILPLFSRMEGAEIAEAMKDWDDARIVRMIRSLRPTKAAEVIAALRTDPRFEQEFRRPPAGAPKGTKTRLERLFEALKD